ncbi:MAG: site-2 protease family protein [Proteobacteria bacterium]|nr:site-2 protease family protein [Pseudomonadota bacterium]
MGRHSIPIGRIFGIAIGLDYSWFVIFAAITWMLGAFYYPADFKDWPTALYWLTAVATAILVFASILLHELGHSVVAMRYGVPVRSITLYLFGGVSQIDAEPPSAIAEFFVAIAGPLVSLFIAIAFYAVRPLVSSVEPLSGLAGYLIYINLGVALFNLIPGYPLDGGRVFRAIVWSITGDMRRATQVAANVGRFFALAMIFGGVWEMFEGNPGGGLWLAFIGWFLDIAATAQLHQLTYQGLLTGHKVAQAMTTDTDTIPEDLTIQSLVDEHIFRSGRRSFLVERQGAPVGLMTLQQIRDVPRSEWSTTRLAQAMLPLEQSISVTADSELWAALQKMDRKGVNQLPVTRGDGVVGMLTREDIITFLATLQELGIGRHGDGSRPS